MGLSSRKTKTTTDQKTTSQQQASTRPSNPEWVEGPLRDWVGQIGAFGEMDPYSFVAPGSPLQQRAWQNAGNLGEWRGQSALASQRLSDIAGRGPNFAGAASLFNRTGNVNIPRLGQARDASVATATGANMGQARQAAAQGYAAPTVGGANLVSGRGYSAPQLGEASGYAAARTGQPIGYRAQSMQAPEVGKESITKFMGEFQNPYIDRVLNSSLANFDQGAAEQQARLAAEGARNKAFGGSRFGVAQAELAGEAARGRGQMAAEIQAQGFREAAGLAAQQAGMNQQANMFGAQLQSDAGRFNADAGNRAAEFGADAQNRFALDLAGRQDAASQFGAAANNQFGLARAGFQADADRFGADAANQAGMFNAGAMNDNSRLNAQLAAQAAQFGAGAQNQANLFNAGAANDFAAQQAQLNQQAGLFNAGAQNQASLANADAANRFGLSQFDADTRGSLFDAEQAQQAGLFNAGALNDMARFNAGQADGADARALQASMGLADVANQYGAGTRADLGTMATLGDQQRGIEQAYALAPLAQLQSMGQLYGTTPFGLFNGQDVSGTSSGTLQGTEVTKQSGSLFDSLLAGATMAGSLFGGGGALSGAFGGGGGLSTDGGLTGGFLNTRGTF